MHKMVLLKCKAWLAVGFCMHNDTGISPLQWHLAVNDPIRCQNALFLWKGGVGEYLSMIVHVWEVGWRHGYGSVYTHPKVFRLWRQCSERNLRCVCVCVLVCGLNEAFILQESFKILSKWVRSAASANALSPNSASWASLHSPRHPHFKQTTRFRPDQHCRLEQQTWCKIMVNQKYEARFSNITNNRPSTQDDIWAWSCCHRSHLMGRSDGRADTHDATLPCSNFNPCSFPVPHNNISYVLLTSSHLTHPLTIQMRLSNH